MASSGPHTEPEIFPAAEQTDNGPPTEEAEVGVEAALEVSPTPDDVGIEGTSEQVALEDNPTLATHPLYSEDQPQSMDTEDIPARSQTNGAGSLECIISVDSNVEESGERVGVIEDGGAEGQQRLPEESNLPIIPIHTGHAEHYANSQDGIFPANIILEAVIEERNSPRQTMSETVVVEEVPPAITGLEIIPITKAQMRNERVLIFLWFLAVLVLVTFTIIVARSMDWNAISLVTAQPITNNNEGILRYLAWPFTLTQAKSIDFATSGVVAPLFIANANFIWFGIGRKLCHPINEVSTSEPESEVQKFESGSFNIAKLGSLIKNLELRSILLAALLLSSALASTLLSNALAYKAIPNGEAATETLYQMVYIPGLFFFGVCSLSVASVTSLALVFNARKSRQPTEISGNGEALQSSTERGVIGPGSDSMNYFSFPRLSRFRSMAWWDHPHRLASRSTQSSNAGELERLLQASETGRIAPGRMALALPQWSILNWSAVNIGLPSLYQPQRKVLHQNTSDRAEAGELEPLIPKSVPIVLPRTGKSWGFGFGTFKNSETKSSSHRSITIQAATEIPPGSSVLTVGESSVNAGQPQNNSSVNGLPKQTNLSQRMEEDSRVHSKQWNYQFWKFWHPSFSQVSAMKKDPRPTNAVNDLEGLLGSPSPNTSGTSSPKPKSGVRSPESGHIGESSGSWEPLRLQMPHITLPSSAPPDTTSKLSKTTPPRNKNKNVEETETPGTIRSFPELPDSSISWRLPSFWLPSVSLPPWKRTSSSSVKDSLSADAQQKKLRDGQLSPSRSSKWGDTKGVQWSVEWEETEPRHQFIMTPGLETLKRAGTRKKAKIANQEGMDRTVQWVETGPSEDSKVKYSSDIRSEQDLQTPGLLETGNVEVNEIFNANEAQLEISKKSRSRGWSLGGLQIPSLNGSLLYNGQETVKGKGKEREIFRGHEQPPIVPEVSKTGTQAPHDREQSSQQWSPPVLGLPALPRSRGVPSTLRSEKRNESSSEAVHSNVTFEDSSFQIHHDKSYNNKRWNVPNIGLPSLRINHERDPMPKGKGKEKETTQAQTPTSTRKPEQVTQISPADDTSLNPSTSAAIWAASCELEAGPLIAEENKISSIEAYKKRDWKLWSLGWPHLVDVKKTQKGSSNPAFGQQTTSIIATNLQTTPPFDLEPSIIMESSNSRLTWDLATNTPKNHIDIEAFTKPNHNSDAQGNENTLAGDVIPPAIIRQHGAKKSWDGWSWPHLVDVKSSPSKAKPLGTENRRQEPDVERAEASGTRAGNNRASKHVESDLGLSIRKASWRFPRLSPVSVGFSHGSLSTGLMQSAPVALPLSPEQADIEALAGSTRMERRDRKSGWWGWRNVNLPPPVVQSEEDFWISRQPGKGKAIEEVQRNRRQMSEVGEEESSRFLTRKSGAVEEVYDEFESTVAMQQYLGL